MTDWLERRALETVRRFVLLRVRRRGGGRASRLAPRASRRAPRASRLAPRASRLAPRSSRQPQRGVIPPGPPTPASESRPSTATIIHVHTTPRVAPSLCYTSPSNTRLLARPLPGPAGA
ncbi:MAG: hypothetical protein B7Z74_05545 [Deltaproteobacteria bacterium 21-66-5]|nr:MAG: hypothetical protein B7Z74_05545 [Deltaproteobacteria bacterium 21-66-5]